MKAMIAISNSAVAPRFDLTLEAVIAEAGAGEAAAEPRLLVISEPSGDELCALAVREGVATVVCGGIDEVHYDYLTWKKIEVIDRVIGPYATALERLRRGDLAPGAILPEAAAAGGG